MDWQRSMHLTKIQRLRCMLSCHMLFEHFVRFTKILFSIMEIKKFLQ